MKFLDEFHIFSFGFKIADNSKNNGTIGRIYKDCRNDVCMDISGFNELVICPSGLFENICVFKDRTSFEKGNRIIFDDTVIEIIDTDIETNEEFNEWCERVELEEDW